MGRKSAYLLGAAASALALSGAGRASETVAYTYDELGRLTAVATSGGPNDALAVSTTYDPAGNRTNYAVSTSGAPPPPPPPPPPGNQPPVANPDSGSTTRCAAKSFAVLGNDTDPDGDLPLALVSVSYNGVRGTATKSGNNVLFTPNDITGNATVSYTMRDSLGATDSSTLSINITNGTNCGPLQ